MEWSRRTLLIAVAVLIAACDLLFLAWHCIPCEGFRSYLFRFRFAGRHSSSFPKGFRPSKRENGSGSCRYAISGSDHGRREARAISYQGGSDADLLDLLAAIRSMWKFSLLSFAESSIGGGGFSGTLPPDP